MELNRLKLKPGRSIQNHKICLSEIASQALKLVVDANVEKFKIINSAPSILAFQALEERLRNVESISASFTRPSV